MTHLRLPGGTDVAEMALFDVDARPAARPDDATAAALEASHRLARFPTGGDGGYLLHLYVDEPIPAALQRCCLVARGQPDSAERLRLNGRLGSKLPFAGSSLNVRDQP